jgi:hypothetical protein
MNRRDFIIGTAAATGVMAGRRSWAQTRDADRRSRLAIMSYGLNTIVKTNQAPSPTRTLDIMDMGQFCADQFGVQQLTLQSYYFPSTEPSWLKDFKARMAKTKTRIVQVNLEFGGAYSMTPPTTPQARLQMIDLHRAWLDKTAFLECPRVMVNQGQITPETREQAIENFRTIVALAKEKRINVSGLNRVGGGGGGRGAARGETPAPAPATPAQPSYVALTDVLRASGASSNVDFMSFPDQKTQLDGIRAMLPISSGLVHAALTYPLEPAMAICRELGFKGIYAVKAVGPQPEGDAVELTKKIIDAILPLM